MPLNNFPQSPTVSVIVKIPFPVVPTGIPFGAERIFKFEIKTLA